MRNNREENTQDITTLVCPTCDTTITIKRLNRYQRYFRCPNCDKLIAQANSDGHIQELSLRVLTGCPTVDRHHTALVGEDKEYEIYGKTLIGKRKDADIVIENQDDTVHYSHAIITGTHGEYEIDPYDENCDIAVNGIQIFQKTNLHSGDMITLGKTTFKYITDYPKASPRDFTNSFQRKVDNSSGSEVNDNPGDDDLPF